MFSKISVKINQSSTNSENVPQAADHIRKKEKLSMTKEGMCSRGITVRHFGFFLLLRGQSTKIDLHRPIKFAEQVLDADRK